MKYVLVLEASRVEKRRCGYRRNIHLGRKQQEGPDCFFSNGQALESTRLEVMTGVEEHPIISSTD